MSKRIAKKMNIEEFKLLLLAEITEIKKIEIKRSIDYVDLYEDKEIIDNKNFLIKDFIFFDKKIRKDIKEVTFDFENFYSYPETMVPYDKNIFMGFQCFDNGLCFFGCTAFGDWEVPVFFIIYHDGNIFRGYIPENGNLWNTTTKMAYGNDKAEDIKNFIKRNPEILQEYALEEYNANYNDLAKHEMARIQEKLEEVDFYELMILNWDFIKKDILETIEVKNSNINPRLEERPSWDEYFVALCEVIKERSLDPKTQVGCVIVNERNKVIATGYNSYPPGCKDEELPFERKGENSKYPWITHAEMNSIISCGRNLQRCIIYVPFLPCPDCFKAIVTSGIKHIKYYGTYESGVNKDAIVRKMAEMTNIKLEKIDVEIPTILWGNH